MKSIMKFKHVNAATLEEAVSNLQEYGDKASVLSGGSDLLGTMRFEVLREYPEVVINLKSIGGLDYIKEEDGVVKIGALTRIHDIATNAVIKKKYTVLAEAAHRTASPHVREMGTIGGNICQLNRCWYFRKEDNRFDCLRKGGQMCYAIAGDNRYHSIFGATRVASPPCTVECPSGVEIPRYMNKIREGDTEGAVKILMKANPFPAITGRVCPHYCETACNRNELDEATSTRAVERYLGDYVLNNAAKIVKVPAKASRKKIAIVGAGPAGLAAAYYLRQAGHSVTVYDRMKEAGGMLSYAIPPYRLPKDIVRKQVKVLEKAGIEFKLGVNVGKDIKLAALKKDYDSVFLACGTWSQGTLGIKGEELLISGLEFLRNVMEGKKGVGKKVLVIGGGNVAIDAATVALRLGAKEVVVASLESRTEMPAFEAEIKAAEEVGVKLMPSWGPNKILAVGEKITGMELVKCTSVFNKEGRFAPEYDKTIKETVKADQIILAIGQRADMTFLGPKPALKIERNLIAVDGETQATNIKGVYAGGDITSGPASVTASIGAGRRAADAIDRYLGGKGLAKVAEEESLKFDCSSVAKTSRIKIEELTAGERQKNIDIEDVKTVGLEAVKTEANRCFNCGCLAVNPSDIAPALVVLDAKIITTKRKIKAEEFWAVDRGIKPTVLDSDEIVTEIQIPKVGAGEKSAFIKFALRKSIDFPIANCAAVIGGGKARICLNAVYNKPYRAKKAEAVITGKKIDEATAEAAGAAVTEDAQGLAYNKYKIQIAKALVKKAILACK